MTQLQERTQHDHPMVIREEGGSGGGMGLGLVLGIILTVALATGLMIMALTGRVGSGNTGAAPTNSNSPTINVNPPDIQVPDTITINPPAQQPGGNP